MNKKRVDLRLSLEAVGGVWRGGRMGISVKQYSKCGLIAAKYLNIPNCLCCGQVRWYCGSHHYALCSPRVWKAWHEFFNEKGYLWSIRWEEVEPHRYEDVYALEA